jgi:hypothetical protein
MTPTAATDDDAGPSLRPSARGHGYEAPDGQLRTCSRARSSVREHATQFAHGVTVARVTVTLMVGVASGLTVRRVGRTDLCGALGVVE